MKIKLKQQYTIHPPGTVIDFPVSTCELLIRRGIAESVDEEKQVKHYPDKSMAGRKRRDK